MAHWLELYRVIPVFINFKSTIVDFVGNIDFIFHELNFGSTFLILFTKSYQYFSILVITFFIYLFSEHN